ncbi:hypothetical protein VTI28DRAFT_1008 [Corynascus sepedonium]
MGPRSMSPGPNMRSPPGSMGPPPPLGMGGMGPRSMSPGPNMRSPPGRMGPMPPQQPRPHMMPHGPPYSSDGPGGPGRHMGNMPPHRQGTPGPVMSPPPPMMSPPPGVGFGMQQGPRPQSPGFQLPPQGQYARPGTPGGPPRPGTPGQMQFHGQAF